MQYQTPSPNPSNEDITVLRIKRKRDQEPLEALVIHQQQQQRRKVPRGLSSRNSTDSLASEWEKSKTPMLFKLGETISETDFSDSIKRRALQNRLKSLSKPKEEHNDDEMDVEDTPVAPPSTKPAAASADARQNTYRVVGKRELLMEEDMPYGSSAVRNMIPQVIPAADLYKEKQRIKMLDAIHADDFSTTAGVSERDPYADLASGSANDSRVARMDPRTVDDLVPIVQNYLSFDSIPTEYVYDFYYIQKEYAGVDPNLLRTSNVGSVLWIDDVNEFMGDSGSNISDEDEDSNAEDFYRNDYPDEPDSDYGMDEFYGSSDEHNALREVAYDPEYDLDEDKW
ncbi:hypothetical protein GGH96_004777 [Coemansia sp. RSA 1972]|nr:hypothetical protein GGH96_004777 [Coemansia sp. RSA 1972]